MAKKKLAQIAEENEIEFDEALSLAQEKLPEGSLTGKGKNTWVNEEGTQILEKSFCCLLYTSPSPRDRTRSRMPSSA